MANQNDKPKVTLYHSEASSLGQIECTVLSAPQKSKFEGKPDYVKIQIGGRERQYNCENPTCAALLNSVKGQRVILEFTGRDADASISVVGQPPPGSAPPQPQSTAASRDTSPAPLTTQATPSAPAAVQAMQSDSVELRDILKDYPDYKLILEGYADELGDQRAKAAKAYRVQVGIPSGQLSVVSCAGSKGL